jgi:hypothetical protein
MGKRYVVGVLMLLVGVLVFAQDTDPPEQARQSFRQGSFYVAGHTGGAGFFSTVNVETTGGAEARVGTRGLDLSASGGYFVADRIAVGPDVRFGFSRFTDAADNVDAEFELSLGVQGAYFLELHDSPWVPTGRLILAYQRRTQKNDGAPADVVENGFAVSPRIGAHYFFGERVAGAVEAAYSLTRRSADDGDTTITGHGFGIAFGVAVFFF